MIRFTGHAIDRYLDFHAIGDASMTPEGARLLLDQHGPSAARTDRRTPRGDEIWQIAGLGIDVVVKVEGEDVVVVTILPPRRLRGLTPIQAERVEALARGAGKTIDVLHEERVVHATAIALPMPTEQADRAVARPEYDAHVRRLQEIRAELALVTAQRETLVPLLRTMRHEITMDRSTKAFRQALRAALRFLVRLPLEQTADVLDQIRAVDPGLLSNAFVYPADETEPSDAASAAFLASRRVKS